MLSYGFETNVLEYFCVSNSVSEIQTLRSFVFKILSLLSSWFVPLHPH